MWEGNDAISSFCADKHIPIAFEVNAVGRQLADADKAYQGLIGDAIWYADALTSADVAELWTYARLKYGITNP